MLAMSNYFDKFYAAETRKMARWPRRTWTTVFTYASVFVFFPVLAFLAYAYVNGWLF